LISDRDRNSRIGFTQSDVDHICSLAKLHLSPELRSRIARDLLEVLEYVERLKDVDTSGVGPMNHCDPAGVIPEGVDRQERGLSRDEALRGAPETLRGYFRVPRVI
jgi:aspartyl-tRNA(Asn)/glutamyl-tRNA(Gln) amidotransferase subunit C